LDGEMNVAVNSGETTSQERSTIAAAEAEGWINIGPVMLPPEPVNAFGMPPETMRFLELAESVGQMSDLIRISFSHSLGPLASLAKSAEIAREEHPELAAARSDWISTNLARVEASDPLLVGDFRQKPFPSTYSNPPQTTVSPHQSHQATPKIPSKTTNALGSPQKDSAPTSNRHAGTSLESAMHPPNGGHSVTPLMPSREPSKRRGARRSSSGSSSSSLPSPSELVVAGTKRKASALDGGLDTAHASSGRRSRQAPQSPVDGAPVSTRATRARKTSPAAPKPANTRSRQRRANQGS